MKRPPGQLEISLEGFCFTLSKVCLNTVHLKHQRARSSTDQGFVPRLRLSSQSDSHTVRHVFRSSIVHAKLYIGPLRFRFSVSRKTSIAQLSLLFVFRTVLLLRLFMHHNFLP